MGISDVGDQLPGLDKAVREMANLERLDDAERVSEGAGRQSAVAASQGIQEEQQATLPLPPVQEDSQKATGTSSGREPQQQRSGESSGDARELPHGAAPKNKTASFVGSQREDEPSSTRQTEENALRSRSQVHTEEHIHDKKGTQTMPDMQGGGTEEIQGSSIERYADRAMFAAAPMQASEPEVNLLWMTSDPLGAIAAACRMYEGKTTYELDEVSNQERAKYWEAMQETHLQAPLEFIEMHFFIENVDRAFTHQLVRQRTAVYAQESLRFGVKEDLAMECSYPPSLMDDYTVFSNQSGLNDARDVWLHALKTIQDAYQWLIANGVPAEDARGLLPQATPTRIHYKTNLRNLLDHAGNRLCTQAQFVWRDVFMKIREAIQEYGDRDDVRPENAWQFDLIAEGAFVPKCYQQGKCTFDSKLDRGCTIRPRVDAFASLGIPSSEWGSYDAVPYADTMRINDEEWLGDPRAAWVK